MNAVFFTTGCVSACNLITPAPGINNSAAAKKLLLFPIEGLFQDALDFFGVKFNVSQAAGQLSNGVVTYSTKKEGHTVYPSSSGRFLLFNVFCRSESSLSGVGSPKKRGLFTKPSSRTAAPSGGGFPVALSFSDNGESTPFFLLCVDLDVLHSSYDATNGFKFDRSDLSDLRSLPLFRKGLYDLPPYAVVTVGYMVTSFVTSNSASANTAFLFNILFVVLLAENIKDEDEQ
jgi:hypothetical protein